MEARVILTKETKEKMEKGLSAFERSKLRIQKLEELDEKGFLSKAATRDDVAKMVGAFDRPYGRGYNWVVGIIRRGVLEETLIRTLPNGKAEYEYHMAKKAKTRKKTNAPKVYHVPEPEIYDASHVDTEPKVLAKIPTGKIPKIIIRYGEISFELEDVDYDFVSKIVDTLISKKGE